MFSLDHLQKYYVPETEISRRVQSLKSVMKKRDVPLIWIDHPTEISYFAGSRQKGVLLISAEDDPVYFVKKSLTRAEAESALTVQPYPGRKRLLKEVRSRMKSTGSLGLSLDITPASTYVWLSESLEGQPVTDVSFEMRRLRSVKSTWEITQIEASAEQATILFNEMDDHVAPGRTELEISASVEKRLRELGHGGTLRIRGTGADLAIITVVGGESALVPTNFDGPSGGAGPYPFSAPGAGDRKVRSGETVIVDMVTTVNGYYADHSRVFFIGDSVPAEAGKAHTFCLDILRQLEKRITPGSVCSDIYKTVSDWAENRGLPEGFMGFGENRVRFFGHGVGLELDEFPILAPRIDLPLEEGMVLAMEPKAYLSGIGPVGIENTYVVTTDGCRSLCSVDPGIRIISTA